ncbi:MAG TPA: hypothetical protein VGL63_13155 [Streptosporangiaceae bacterium]|jgi:hypothetical protein
MTNHMKFAVGGIVLGIILLFIIPSWAAILIIAAAIGIPAAAWFMLDPSQRRRLKEARRRGQIGR